MRGKYLILCAALVGCQGAAPDASRPVTVPAELELGAEASVVHRRTLVRDPAPSCAELTEGLTDPSAALLEVAERVTQPPSAGMRAATCLVSEHAAEVEPQLTRWVSERETMGFGLMVLSQLDSLDDELAGRLATAAMAGDFAEQARPRIARSRQGAVVDETGDVAPR